MEKEHEAEQFRTAEEEWQIRERELTMKVEQAYLSQWDRDKRNTADIEELQSTYLAQLKEYGDVKRNTLLLYDEEEKLEDHLRRTVATMPGLMEALQKLPNIEETVKYNVAQYALFSQGVSRRVDSALTNITSMVAEGNRTLAQISNANEEVHERMDADMKKLKDFTKYLKPLERISNLESMVTDIASQNWLAHQVVQDSRPSLTEEDLHRIRKTLEGRSISDEDFAKLFVQNHEKFDKLDRPDQSSEIVRLEHKVDKLGELLQLSLAEPKSDSPSAYHLSARNKALEEENARLRSRINNLMERDNVSDTIPITLQAELENEKKLNKRLGEDLKERAETLRNAQSEAQAFRRQHEKDVGTIGDWTKLMRSFNIRQRKQSEMVDFHKLQGKYEESQRENKTEKSLRESAMIEKERLLEKSKRGAAKSDRLGRELAEMKQEVLKYRAEIKTKDVQFEKKEKERARVQIQLRDAQNHIKRLEKERTQLKEEQVKGAGSKSSIDAKLIEQYKVEEKLQADIRSHRRQIEKLKKQLEEKDLELEQSRRAVKEDAFNEKASQSSRLSTTSQHTAEEKNAKARPASPSEPGGLSNSPVPAGPLRSFENGTPPETLYQDVSGSPGPPKMPFEYYGPPGLCSPDVGIALRHSRRIWKTEIPKYTGKGNTPLYRADRDASKRETAETVKKSRIPIKAKPRQTTNFKSSRSTKPIKPGGILDIMMRSAVGLPHSNASKQQKTAQAAKKGRVLRKDGTKSRQTTGSKSSRSTKPIKTGGMLDSIMRSAIGLSTKPKC